MTRKSLLTGLFIGIAVSKAWGLDVSQVMENLKAREHGTKAIQFNFSQQVQFLDKKLTALSEGEAIFESPKNLKVLQSKPHEQLTISNGKKVWVYTPSYKQVWVGGGGNWIQSAILPKGMVPFQNVASDLATYFDLSIPSESTEESREVRLLAVPKDKAMGYELEFIFSTDTWLPSQTIYHSESANVVTTLSKWTVNPDLSKTSFTFSPPAGTEIIPLN